MNNIDKVALKSRWKELLDKLEERFGKDLDMQGIIFLIGVQELGKGVNKFNKNQKQDIMHIAICKLLSQWGYYKLEGLDAEGWPHWKCLEKLPLLSLAEQDQLLKQAIVDYFCDEGSFSIEG